MTVQLTHFSAAFVFALFASIVFGITHRDTTREMVSYGFYCFSLFLGGAITSLPVFLTLARPQEAFTRYTVAVCQMLMSSLLIHLTGGRAVRQGVAVGI